MAIYNLSYGKLESLIDHSYATSTEHAIIDAIKSAGIVTPWSGKTGVEVQTKSGAYTVPQSAGIFLDTGSHNTITIKDDGAKLITAGDGSNHIVDKGPGGDTLVGGTGAASLQVTNGDNELIAGSGANTLMGGAGHDTLIGGGASLLEAGSGGSTLIGGQSDEKAAGRHAHTVLSDTLMGGQGDDLLRVSHGDNLLIAQDGHDTIYGGDGHDTIFGGGADTINLNYGNEFVQGGSGTDRVNVGLHGNDVIYGGAATTVHTTQTHSSIKSEVEVHGVTTITFSNHQVLTLSNVTLEFADGHKTIIH